MTGGNSYYLNWCIHESGFDTIIIEYCKRGLVYGGESAGAIVAGPTLQHFQTIDNPNDAPEIILDGMRLTGIVIVPHIDNEKYGQRLATIQAALHKDGFETIPLTDSQAIVIDTAQGQIKKL